MQLVIDAIPFVRPFGMSKTSVFISALEEPPINRTTRRSSR